MRIEPVRSGDGAGRGDPGAGRSRRSGGTATGDARLDRRPVRRPPRRGTSGSAAPRTAGATSSRPPRRSRAIALARPLDLALTLGPLQRGRFDPCVAIEDRHVWRATRTPEGPASVHVHHAEPRRVVVEAWGPGADWAVEHAPGLVGEHDDLDAFEALLDRAESPAAPMVRRLHRAVPGLRIPRTGALSEAVVPVVLEQRVTGRSARRSWRGLVRVAGEPAPAMAGAPRPLRLPPHPDALVELPEFTWHRLGVEARRAATVRRVAARATRLDEAVDHPGGVALQRLGTIGGIGPWTVAEAGRPALGDPDLVTVGDYHLPHHIAWALRRQPRGDDAGLLDALAPFAGQRGRVCRLIVLGTPGAPAFGPRKAEFDISSL